MSDPLFFEAGGGRLGYRRYGEGGPLHVLLAGGPGLDAAYLTSVGGALAARGRTVAVLDQRGTGSSKDAFGDGTRLTIADAVADLDALRDTLQAARLSLLGHSWGAMLAMAYAAAHRDRVSNLALLDPGGPDLSFNGPFFARITQRLVPEDMAAVQAAQARGENPFRALLPGYFHDRAQGLAFAAALPADYGSVPVYDALMRDAAAHYDVTQALRGNAIPALLLYGDDDPALVAREQLGALFPNATNALVPAAGHFPWVENRDRFEAAVFDFLGTSG